MTKFTVSILGLGSIGLRHARNLRSMNQHVLGFDPSAEVTARFVSEVDAKQVERDIVLTQADAVVVASPSRFHLDDLESAIDAGKPVLVEKPLGHDVQLAGLLLKKAEKAGVPVAVAQNLRFRAVVGGVSALLRAGKAGDPVWANFLCGSWLPDWRAGSDYRKSYAADPETGGVIFDCIHELDLAEHLLGSAHVCACSVRSTGLLEIPSEDLADILLEHENGHRTQVHLDYVTRPRRRQLTIAGSDGIIAANLHNGVLTLTRPDDTVAFAETYEFDPNAEYLAVMENFLAVVAGKTVPACPGEDALKVLRNACDARAMAGLPSAAATVQDGAALS